MYSIVNLLPNVLLSDENETKSTSTLSCESSSEKGNGVPVYSLYILGTVTILFLIALIALSVYIHLKLKCKKLEITTRLENGTQCQTCKKKTNSKSENENNPSRKRIQSKSVTTDFNTLRSPKKQEASGDKSPKLTTGVAKDLSYILPNQMTSICNEVLKRPDENDSASSLHKIDQLVNEGKLQDTTAVKSAPIPNLDIYDKVPKTKFGINLSKMRGGKAGKDKLKAKCEIYDFPKDQSSLYDFPKRKDGNKNPKPSTDIYDFPKEHNFLRHLPKSNDGKKSDVPNPGIYDFPASSKHFKMKCKESQHDQTNAMSYKQSAIIKNESTDDSMDNIYVNANDLEML
ncbi:uncharacterized protein LOC125230808 [Leguminivora glycinivorella]|uniref:uncharacterized protein LOC125230808 n=1 Tax=Leguminivora glycinivorella TaxID=1035111 RepID=UPI00200D950C|nr:uncharacterized protein LOC125230808 [Leguminivora glycinivorella]